MIKSNNKILLMINLWCSLYFNFAYILFKWNGWIESHQFVFRLDLFVDPHSHGTNYQIAIFGTQNWNKNAIN